MNDRLHAACVLLCAVGCIGVSSQRSVESTLAAGPEVSVPADSNVGVSPLIKRTAPDFTATAVMPDNEFATIKLSDYRGKYVVLFFYPGDFTFVCPTEIIAFDEKLDEFASRNCQLLAASVDSKYVHRKWKETPRKQGGVGAIRYPLLADSTKNIARSFGVLWDASVALRGLFLIDREGIIRHVHVNDLGLGRNVEEVLRTLDMLVFVDTHGDEVCPANWRAGKKTLKTTLDDVADYLSSEKEEEEKTK